MTLYRYGWIAGVWRVLGAAALAAAVAAGYGALHLRALWPAIVASTLAAPTLALGWMVATRIDIAGDVLHVRTLSLLRRRIARSALGRPRLHLTATAELLRVPAPRLWVPVKGGAPIYVDLLADIPDRDAFASVFPLSPAVLRALEDHAAP